ncbi:GNAT family N-acetyltransferase [Haloferax sp. Atlit-10N]|uniref:GNAT family N-acetyltransferase n=1 Tax=Haloferax TaxID=2251 RepID=UPI000679E3F5|nr:MULTISPECIES: GNAT family N-acetyltransferase [Haloferax]RDZ44163.1 GNAT family N-acetyltransferase [Haloferax sp. Atlit-16N]RDZ47652.1 GNAT family N-acetyltransferase [Haloferax sp. Atlit-19N]RDZ58208.1 GNAT family N-acetyltransferase [Haloferax sp. Atlit-10N]
MEVTDSLNFGHKDRKDIYEYIERHGTVREDEVRRALNFEPAALGAHLTVLRRDGYIRKVGNYVEVAYAPGEEETVELGDLDVTIRMAQNVDLESLVDAIHEVADEGRYIEAETVADLLDHEEVVLRHNEVSSRMVFVATVGDELAGWVHLDLPEAEKLSHTAVLTVGTRPEFRGHGIGSKLLDRGVDWARERGFEKLYNSVPATNEEAIAFLEGHGWETEAVRDAHYKIDGDYVDEVMMAVSLR